MYEIAHLFYHLVPPQQKILQIFIKLLRQAAKLDLDKAWAGSRRTLFDTNTVCAKDERKFLGGMYERARRTELQLSNRGEQMHCYERRRPN